MAVEEKPVWYLTMQDLITAIAAPSRRRKPQSYAIAQTRLYSLEESVLRLRSMLGVMPAWDMLQAYLPDVIEADEVLQVRSALASTFAATLELVKNGELELRQDGTFAPIYMRRREQETDRAGEA